MICMTSTKLHGHKACKAFPPHDSLLYHLNLPWIGSTCFPTMHKNKRGDQHQLDPPNFLPYILRLGPQKSNWKI